MSVTARLAALLAILAAAAALWFLLGSGGPAPEPVVELAPDAERRPRIDDDGRTRLPQGGVYAGRVVDLEGRPIHGAHVLLVEYETGAPDMLTAGSGLDRDPEDIGDVPVIGRYGEAGEGITDEDGAFRIAADSQSTVTRVLAYHKGYFLAVVAVDRPRDDILLRLQRGGRVIGTVVDEASGAPVGGARVDIYLQQKVEKVPDVSPDAGPYPVIKREQHETAWLATLGRFTSKVLGPRIWDVVDSGSETLRLYTDANGHFEIGPLGNTVQLEFVITHPKYKWYDFDTDEGKRTPKRLVVEPGQTVEREFRLREGFHIAGQVVDDQGQGVDDVYVKVQSISAYYRHWWYRDKWRVARTDSQGRFRVDGLTLGSQQVIFQHPSFKEKTISVDDVPAEDLLVVAERFGAVEGRIEGVAADGRARRVTVFFESREREPTSARQFRRTEALERGGRFLVQRVPPGAYRIWIRVGKSSSQPKDVDVEPLAVATVDFGLGAGGVILARVVDEHGGVVDPASLRLVALGDGEARQLGTFVTREGEVEIEGVAPGRYRLRVQAPGRIESSTEPFEVSEGRTASLGAILLPRWGFLRFGTPVNLRDRPARITQDLVLEYREPGGAWQRVHNAGVQIPVRPGRIEVRAVSGAMRFEDGVDVKGGETAAVRVVFDDGR